MNIFKFLTDNKPKIRYTQAVLPTGHVLAPLYQNHNEFVNNFVKMSILQFVWWRNHIEYIQENGRTIILTITNGINIGGMMHITYKIQRDEFTEHYTTRFPLND